MLNYLNYWDGVETFHLCSFTKKDVFRAIELLDGDDISGIQVRVDTGATLGIGGGKGDQFICLGHPANDGTAQWLISDVKTDSSICDIAFDSDTATVPSEYVVGLKQLRSAVEWFCDLGELIPTMTWRKEHSEDFNPWV